VSAHEKPGRVYGIHGMYMLNSNTNISIFARSFTASVNGDAEPADKKGVSTTYAID
jgi:hypothetical protein